MLFIFDAHCSQRFADGLNLLEEGNTRSPLQAEVKHMKAFLPGNASDEELIEMVGKKNAILITYDRGFKTIKHRYKLYKEHNAAVIFYHSYKDVIHYWDIVVSFIKKWEELKKEINKYEKPFAVEISNTGFKQLTFK
jgi:PIN domain-containing protein